MAQIWKYQDDNNFFRTVKNGPAINRLSIWRKHFEF